MDEKVGVCMDICHISDAGYDIVNDIDGVDVADVIGTSFNVQLHEILLLEDIPFEVQDQEKDRRERIDSPRRTLLREGLAYRLELLKPSVVLLHLRQEPPNLREGIEPRGPKNDVEVFETVLEVPRVRHEDRKTRFGRQGIPPAQRVRVRLEEGVKFILIEDPLGRDRRVPGSAVILGRGHQDGNILDLLPQGKEALVGLLEERSQTHEPAFQLLNKQQIIEEIRNMKDLGVDIVLVYLY